MCEAANEKPFVAPAAEDTPHRLCSCNPLQPADPRVAGESQARREQVESGQTGLLLLGVLPQTGGL